MPKLTNRERLAKIEIDQRKLSEEAETVRRAVRTDYASILLSLTVEVLSERDFRDIVTHAIRLGGPAAIARLKADPPG